MSNTLTTELTASSGNFNIHADTISIYQSRYTNTLTTVDRVINTIMQPAYSAMLEYIEVRQAHLNSQLASDSNLLWRSPLTHASSLCAFDGGADSFVKEGGAFANIDDWTDPDNFSSISHWSIELWSTAALSSNRIDLPNYQEITIQGIGRYANSFETYDSTLGHALRTNIGPTPQGYIDQIGLGNKYVVQDFINYVEDWEFSMEWINSDPRVDNNSIAGLRYQADTIKDGITMIKPLTAFEKKKMSVSTRHVI